jgi:hypothetical protein
MVTPLNTMLTTSKNLSSSEWSTAQGYHPFAKQAGFAKAG